MSLFDLQVQLLNISLAFMLRGLKVGRWDAVFILFLKSHLFPAALRIFGNVEHFLNLLLKI